MRRRPAPIHPGRRRSAFTLIELLVVMLILAILMALLTPALARAHRQARNIVCMTNLKNAAFDFQVALNDPGSLRRWDSTKASPRSFGLSSFIDQFYLAGAYYPDGSRSTTYARGSKPFVCPMAPNGVTVMRYETAPQPGRQVLNDGIGAISPQRHASYGFNARLYRIYRGENPDMGGAVPWYVSLGQRFLNSSEAGRTVLLSDFDGARAAQVASATPHLVAPPIEPSGFYGAEPGTNAKGLQWFPSFRHDGMCNAALVDGSVVSRTEPMLLDSPTTINWADAGYDGFWKDGNFFGTGELTRTVLFSADALDSSPVH